MHLTRACNRQCVYCYLSAGEPIQGELTTREWLACWRDIVQLRPGKVVLTGGEPLLRPDLMELIAGLRSADTRRTLRVALNTNGVLLAETVAEELAPLVDEVRVSVDAMRGRNDELRGEGSFDAAVRALRILRETGIEAHAMVALSRHAIPDLAQLLELLADLGVKRTHLHVQRSVGRAASRPDLQISAEQASGIVHGALVSAARGADRHQWLRRIVPSNCGAGSYVNIMPDGEVFPCHVLTGQESHCGNIRRSSIADICGPLGLIARLRSLDFREIATTYPELECLADAHSCLGEVLSRSRERAVWGRLLGTHGFPPIAPAECPGATRTGRPQERPR